MTFPTRTFTTLQITIDATNAGKRTSYSGLSGVGFAEVRLPGQQVHEVLRMPEDLLKAAGPASLSHRLSIVMTRQTDAPVPPATDPEVDIARTFTLPTARTFSVSGTAQLSALVPDDVLDRLLGTTVPGVVAAYSSGRLPGDVSGRTSTTLDGNVSEVWSPGLGPQAGNWLEYDLVHPITFDHLSMAMVTDGRHSVPTSITVSAGGQSRTVSLPPLVDKTQPWSTQTVTVSFPAITGANVRVTFDSVRPVTDLDYYSERQIELPIGIAEMGIPGMPRAVPGPAQLPAPCRSDLLTVDGTPVPITITGTTASAQSLGVLQVKGCGSAATGITLGAGPHEVQTQPGFPPGVDIDSLVFDSAPGGAALATTPSGTCAADPIRAGPSSHGGAFLCHLGPGRRPSSQGPVLVGAGREQQRGMARHHGLGDGTGDTPADRRIRQRLARHADARRPGHGDLAELDTAAIGVDRAGGVGRGDRVVPGAGPHRTAPSARSAGGTRGGAGRADRHLPGAPTRGGGGSGGGRGHVRHGIEHASGSGDTTVR